MMISGVMTRSLRLRLPAIIHPCGSIESFYEKLMYPIEFQSDSTNNSC